MEQDIKAQIGHILDQTIEHNKDITEEFTRFVMAWADTAATMNRNANYYRNLLVKIGNLLGPRAMTADDGTFTGEVLVAKVPELVEQLIKDMTRHTNTFAWNEPLGKVWEKEYDVFMNSLKTFNQKYKDSIQGNV